MTTDTFQNQQRDLAQWIFAVFSFLLILLTLIAMHRVGHEMTLTGDLPINAPKIANAGDEIAVTVGPVSVNNNTPIGLVVVGTHGPRVYNTVFESGLAHFIIPPKDTRQPGYLALIAASEDARGETSIILNQDRTASASHPQSEGTMPDIANVSTPNQEEQTP